MNTVLETKLFLAGALFSLASFCGCVTDHNYVRQNSNPPAWEQQYHGNPPKFMQDPFHNIKVPTYTQMKFKR
ncbi:MAG: hypothetical protein NTW67_05755 [Candidatus Woesearchaeota archaeon]|nr:hypothetical protein [Candidatus Woesearchaeota archaeon]